MSGFSSEWLLLQGLLHGFSDQSTPVLIIMLLGVVALALTGGLTAVAFVKAFGIGFLGQPRSDGARDAQDIAPSMKIAMGLLALPSILIGVAPGVVMPLINRAALLVGTSSTASPIASGMGLQLNGLRGVTQPFELLIGIVVVMVALWAGSLGLARRRARRVDAWGCGRDVQTPRMQYTATSFAEPLQRVFADVLRPQSDVEVTHVAESRYYEQSLLYENQVRDVLEHRGYRPVIDTAIKIGTSARRIQNGSIHRYLAFGFIALLVILVVLA